MNKLIGLSCKPGPNFLPPKTGAIRVLRGFSNGPIVTLEVDVDPSTAPPIPCAFYCVSFGGAVPEDIPHIGTTPDGKFCIYSICFLGS